MVVGDHYLLCGWPLWSNMSSFRKSKSDVEDGRLDKMGYTSKKEWDKYIYIWNYLDHVEIIHGERSRMK